MKVFNLSEKDLDYRGKKIAANGGSQMYADLKFIPNRDLQLEKNGVIAFGTLPAGWQPKVRKSVAPPPPVPAAPQVIKLEVSDQVPVTDAAQVEKVLKRKT